MKSLHRSCDLVAWFTNGAVERAVVMFRRRDEVATHVGDLESLLESGGLFDLLLAIVRHNQEKRRNIFAFRRRSHKVEIIVDPKLAQNLTDELAQQAMDICPVGALLFKEEGLGGHLLAGLMIFPIVFANGLDPAEGPGFLGSQRRTFGSDPALVAERVEDAIAAHRRAAAAGSKNVRLRFVDSSVSLPITAMTSAHNCR